MKRLILAALLTVILGVLSWVIRDMFPYRVYETRFAELSSDFGPFETITGIPYPTENGQVRITEPLAHVRVPFGHTGLAKHLELTTTFHIKDADVLEVGIRKSDFWLDYERIPLGHRILDELGETARSDWKVLRSDRKTVFLNPRYENPYSTVEEFLARSPTDGVMGLYGNASLPQGSVSIAPFRATDDPAQFRAIYANYVPASPSGEARTITMRFPLDQAYQNPDGSFDLMYFTQRADGKPARVAIEKLRGSIEPTVPESTDLLMLVRRAARSLLIRSHPPS